MLNLRSMKEILREAKFIIFFLISPVMLLDNSGRIARDLRWRNNMSFPLPISFHCGSSWSWGRTIGPLVATVQRHSLTPSTWSLCPFVGRTVHDYEPPPNLRDITSVCSGQGETCAVFSSCITVLSSNYCADAYTVIESRGWVVSVSVCCEKVKVKPSRYTPWRRLGERIYSSYSFTTSTLDGVSGQHHAPAAFYPRGRTPGTHWTGGWAPEPVWTQRLEEKSFTPAGDRTPIARSSSP
jgi:hypothetical protein